MPEYTNTETQRQVAGDTSDNLKSEAFSELISARSSFLSRWALLIFLSIISLLVYSTWFIHYPDIIKTRATLTATNAPKEIIALESGRLLKLFIGNDEPVSKNTIIGFIEGNGKHEEILLLGAILDSTLLDLQRNNTPNIISRFSVNMEHLGDIQQGYQQFTISYQQFSDYLQNGFYLKKKYALAEDFTDLHTSHDIIQQQKELMLKDLRLSEESYKASESLLKDKVISRQDERTELSKLLSKQLSITQVNATILNNETQQREKQKEINELEHTISQQKLLFEQSIHTLQNQVLAWQKKYILKAPVTGKVSMIVPLQENQFLQAGKVVGFVNPTTTNYYVEVNLPQYNFGKIETGQQVQLRFDAYPYQEFGYVKGYLSYVTAFATDTGFLANIQLLNGLVTDQGKTLHYRDGLKAEAQIITKDMRLMERLYNSFTSTIRRQ